MPPRILHGAFSPCARYQVLTPRSTRLASLASAISRGIRRAEDRSAKLGSSAHIKNADRDGRSNGSREQISRLDIERRRDTGDRTARSSRYGGQRTFSKKEDISQEAPFGKPYTTAGSEFLYGTFAVKAALEAGRRKLHKLYIWRGQDTQDAEHDHSIPSLARAKKVPVQMVAGSWDKMLLKMSNQRPHNGVILEASPIPKLPVVSLNPMNTPADDVQVRTGKQSLEDESVNNIFVNSSGGTVIPRSGGSGGDKARYPLLLWLDRITDTGNLGAIMRTCYFIGVDAIIIPEHGTAPFSPVTVKASAGAAELLPIMIVKHEVEFVRLSQENGWKFIAAVAPDSTSTWKSLSQQGSFTADAALDSHPCVLMVGNEGEGLRPNMQKAANNFVSIRGVRGPADGVESLNVSVAAALLVARMLSRPSNARKQASPSASTPQTSTAQREVDSSLF